MMLIALGLLCDFSALIDALGSRSVEIRESATEELFRYGRLAVPSLRAALRTETDPEVLGRIELLLSNFVGVRLEIDRRTVERPQSLNWWISLENEGEGSVEVAMDLACGSLYFRYPVLDLELEFPNGERRRVLSEIPRRHEHARVWTTRLRPGAVTDVQQDELRMEPSFPLGRYRMRAIYDSSPPEPEAWVSPGAEIPAETRSDLLRVYHGRLTSEWVEFEVVR